jgi:hypothetical protein
MMFCPVVTVVCGAGAPEKSELLLADAATLQPMEVHIHSFGELWLHHLFVDNALGC